MKNLLTEARRATSRGVRYSKMSQMRSSGRTRKFPRASGLRSLRPNAWASEFSIAIELDRKLYVVKLWVCNCKKRKEEREGEAGALGFCNRTCRVDVTCFLCSGYTMYTEFQRYFEFSFFLGFLGGEVDQIFALYGVLKKSANIAAIILFLLLEIFVLISSWKNSENYFSLCSLIIFVTLTPLANKLKGWLKNPLSYLELFNLT